MMLSKLNRKKELIIINQFFLFLSTQKHKKYILLWYNSFNFFGNGEIFFMFKFIEVQHPQMVDYMPVRLISWNDKLGIKKDVIFNKAFYEELLYLGYTDYQDDKIRRTTTSLQQVIKQYDSYPCICAEKTSFYEIELPKEWDEPKMLKYLFEKHSGFMLYQEGRKICIFFSFVVEKLKKDSKLKPYVEGIKPLEFKHKNATNRKNAISYPNGRKAV